MAKYVVDETTMAGIADPLRGLAGHENSMTPAEMVAAGNAAVSEVVWQADLIEQIKTILAGKAGGGGGNNSNLTTSVLGEAILGEMILGA